LWGYFIWQHTVKKKTGSSIDANPRNSCPSLLPADSVPCEHIASLINYINNNKRKILNSAVHSINTRKKPHLHRPLSSPSCFQKSTNYLASNSPCPPTYNYATDNHPTFNKMGNICEHNIQAHLCNYCCSGKAALHISPMFVPLVSSMQCAS
jgi:hypothetical protein